jgi:hypothetical protein
MAKNSSEINVRPWCPFCGQTVERPRDIERRKIGEFPVGQCQCGAVYASDPTGFNVGACMIEALVYAANDNWDLAWDLMPEDDYLTDRLERYDEISNQIVESGNIDGRKVRGVLYFVRLQGDIAKLADRVSSEKKDVSITEHYIPTLEPEKDAKRTRKRANKKDIKSLVEQNDIDGLVDFVFDDLKTLRFMQRLLYSMDESLRWRTINALGKVCARFATRNPGKISDFLHQLFAACSDSASSSWGNIEAIGAIIGERPDIFGAFSPHLLNYLGDPARQGSVLWALNSIARNKPALIRKMPFYQLFDLLEYMDPQIRGNALRLFGKIKATEARSKIQALLNDPEPLTFYEEGLPVTTTVGALAGEALKQIEDQGESR